MLICALLLQGRCTCLEARMVDMVTMLSSNAAVTSSTLPKMNVSFTSLKGTTVKSMLFHLLLMRSSRSSRAASWLASMLSVTTSGCCCTTCVQHNFSHKSIPQTFFLIVLLPSQACDNTQLCATQAIKSCQQDTKTEPICCDILELTED